MSKRFERLSVRLTIFQQHNIVIATNKRVELESEWQSPDSKAGVPQVRVKELFARIVGVSLKLFCS